MPISPEMVQSITAGAGVYATLVKVTADASRGGDSVGYALHTRDVTFEGFTYTAAPFEPSKLAQKSGTSVDNATITHLLNDLFTRENIKGGKWRGAKIVVQAVDLADLDHGPVLRHNGRLGDVTTEGTQARSEFRGISQLLSQEIGDRTSRRCRYVLGDENCGVDLAAFTFAGTVTTVHNNQRVTVSVSKPDSYFKYGRIRFTSGLNDGLEMETIDNTGQMVTLFLPMPAEIQVGDAVELVAGDDKSLATCHDKFNNAINHGGEDCMPPRERLLRFPS